MKKNILLGILSVGLFLIGSYAVLAYVGADLFATDNDVMNSFDIEIAEAAIPLEQFESEQEEFYLSHVEDVYCIHSFEAYTDSYHTIDGAFISYVGIEEYLKWKEIIEKENELYTSDECSAPCGNIIRFVRDFAITKEIFQEIMTNWKWTYYLNDYNIDIIYSDDDELIRNYYTSSAKRYELMAKREGEYNFKDNLLIYVQDTQPEKIQNWLKSKDVKNKQINNDNKSEVIKLYTLEDEKGNDVSAYSSEFNLGRFGKWSIAEIIEEFNITKDQFIAIYDNSSKAVEDMCEYNLDILFNKDERINYMIENNVNAFVIDSMYSSSDGIFRDNLIYEASVEAINSGRDISISEINQVIELNKR